MTEVRRVCADISPRLYGSPVGRSISSIVLDTSGDGGCGDDGGHSPTWRPSTTPGTAFNARVERRRLAEENQRLRRTLQSSSRKCVLGGRPVTVKSVSGAGFRSSAAGGGGNGGMVAGQARPATQHNGGDGQRRWRGRASDGGGVVVRGGGGDNVNTRLGRGWRSAELDPHTGELGRPPSSDMRHLFAHASLPSPARTGPGGSLHTAAAAGSSVSPPPAGAAGGGGLASGAPSPTDLDGLLVARRRLLNRPGAPGNPEPEVNGILTGVAAKLRPFWLRFTYR
jgi:hypothetical protein